MVYHEAFGLYEGEPEIVEILQRKYYHTINGANSLAIYHTCPVCDSNKAEWIRQEWAICFQCEIAFDAWELYTDLTEDEKPMEEILEEI